MKNKDKSVSANFRRAKILVVEDNDDQWIIMQQAMLRCLGEVTVNRVATTEQAIIYLEKNYGQEWEIPKLILLDLYLPQCSDGLQLLRQIKAMPEKFNRVPIIMLTVSQAVSDVVKAYDLGVSAYMIKPVDFAAWLTLFKQIRAYWWETVTLPPIYYGN